MLIGKDGPEDSWYVCDECNDGTALNDRLAALEKRIDALEGWRKSICVDASGALCPGPEQPEPDREDYEAMLDEVYHQPEPDEEAGSFISRDSRG